jgi:hypothetical protein
LLIAVYANTQQSKSLCDISISPPNMDRFTVFEIEKAQEIHDVAYDFTRQNFASSMFKKN